MAAFDEVFDRLFENEGGYQCDSEDRGNWTGGAVGHGYLKGTKYGISAMSYPDLDIRNLDKCDAKAIYLTCWWDKHKLYELGFPLAYQVFDAAVHHGMKRAAVFLQKVIGVKVDGFIGPITISKAKSIKPEAAVMGFISERLDFMTRIGSWREYSAGWARRISHNIKLASEDFSVPS